MITGDQMTLPGFATVKRLRRKANGVLELREYDLLQWKEHEALLNGRSAALPRPPRSHAGDAYQTWHTQAEQLLAQPIPTVRPVQVWELGPFSGAGVFPWLQGKREALTSSQVRELREYLQGKETVPESRILLA